MSKTFTPGPWTAFNHSWCETSISAPGSSNSICLLDINHATEESQMDDEEQMAANARLIASAPELLDALQTCFDSGSMTGGEWVVDKALAAIKKATGAE